MTTNEAVTKAYGAVAEMLKTHVNKSNSPEEFAMEMAYCQIFATRMLGILVFNSSGKDPATLEANLEKIREGLAQEIKEISAADSGGQTQFIDVLCKVPEGTADAEAH